MLYERIIAPLLFMMEAEAAHDLALRVLRLAGRNQRALELIGSRVGDRSPRLRRTVGLLSFPHPIGLAAGFDKNGVAFPALAALGFGFVTIGTVTPGNGQPGKPKPRLFRNVPERALWNRLGFNNRGADRLARRLDLTPSIPVPLGISLGKAAVTPLETATDDYLASLERLYPYPDYFEICISSPNTEQLRALQGAEPLDDLLGRLVARSNELAAEAGLERRKPLWPKLAPDMTPADRDQAVEICRRHLDPDLDAIVMGNTTIDPTFNPDLAKGGYSGRPLFPKALTETRAIRDALRAGGGKPVALVGVGGIYDGHDALAMLRDGGCQLVQVHSAFPYRGPLVARKIRHELLREMDVAGLAGLTEIAAEPGASASTPAA